MIKISFLGDIMCEPPLFRAAKKGNSYNFSYIFENVKELIENSDYVVGNLETPLAGRGAGFVNGLFSFNAPDEFAQAIKNAGVDFVSTANNHCMDRGIEGLKRTVRVLDNIGLAHDGTYADCDDHNPFVASINGECIAIIPFTYGTNYSGHKRQLPDQRYVNLLHDDTEPFYISNKKVNFRTRINQFLFGSLRTEQIMAIKKALGKEYKAAKKDDYLDEKASSEYFQNLEKKIQIAKESADVVVFYPHVGGQFNLEPGRFTEYTVEKGLEYGADVIIASHPHIVQKAEIRDGHPVFYSIGNFSMSPNSIILLHENLPEYGLIVHLYIDNATIIKTTFSIIKIIEQKNQMLTVWPVQELYRDSNLDEKRQIEKDVQKILNNIMGHCDLKTIIKAEYELKENSYA